MWIGWFAGDRLRDSRSDVFAAAADAVRVFASPGPSAPHRRRRLSAAQLHGDGERLAGHLERPRSLAARGRPEALLLDHPRRLLRLPRPPQLQQLRPRARRLHRRRGRVRQVRRFSLPLPATFLQGESYQAITNRSSYTKIRIEHSFFYLRILISAGDNFNSILCSCFIICCL